MTTPVKKRRPAAKPITFDAVAITPVQVDASTGRLGINQVGEGARVFKLGAASKHALKGYSAAEKRVAAAQKGRPTIKAMDCCDEDYAFECDFEQFMLTMYALAKTAGVTIPPVPKD